jgi:HEAT repeat protein
MQFRRSRALDDHDRLVRKQAAWALAKIDPKRYPEKKAER